MAATNQICILRSVLQRGVTTAAKAGSKAAQTSKHSLRQAGAPRPMAGGAACMHGWVHGARRRRATRGRRPTSSLLAWCRLLCLAAWLS